LFGGKAPFLKGLLGQTSNRRLRASLALRGIGTFLSKKGAKWTGREEQKLGFVSKTENNFPSLGVKPLSF